MTSMKQLQLWLSRAAFGVWMSKAIASRVDPVIFRLGGGRFTRLDFSRLRRHPEGEFRGVPDACEVRDGCMVFADLLLLEMDIAGSCELLGAKTNRVVVV